MSIAGVPIDSPCMVYLMPSVTFAGSATILKIIENQIKCHKFDFENGGQLQGVEKWDFRHVRLEMFDSILAVVLYNIILICRTISLSFIYGMWQFCQCIINCCSFVI